MCMCVQRTYYVPSQAHVSAPADSSRASAFSRGSVETRTKRKNPKGTYSRFIVNHTCQPLFKNIQPLDSCLIASLRYIDRSGRRLSVASQYLLWLSTYVRVDAWRFVGVRRMEASSFKASTFAKRRDHLGLAHFNQSSSPFWK